MIRHRLALALVLTWPTVSPAETALETFRSALRRDDLRAARELADSQVALLPEDSDWRLAKADLLAHEGRVVEALALVKRSASDDPSHRPTRIREAQLLSQLGRLRSAEETYARCLRDFPKDPDARNGLGLTRLWRGDWRGAQARFAESLRLAPDSETARVGQLRVMLGNGLVRDAWEMGRAQDRATGESDAELGLLLAGLAGRAGASSEAQSLAARPSDDPDLQSRQAMFRAGVLIRAGQLEQGLALVRPWVTPSSAPYDTLLEAANLHAAADRRSEARALFERAIQRTPERPEAIMGLARLASREGRLAGSLALYKQLVAANPQSLEGWLGVVRTARLLDDATSAREGLSRAWNEAPDSAILFREQLRFDLQAGDLAAFQEHLRRYREKQPEDREAMTWELRLRALGTTQVDPAELTALVDPLSPEQNALLGALALRTGADPSDILERAESLAPEAWRAPLRLATARSLALQLQPAAARRLAGTTPAADAAAVDCLAEGWWAFVTTPVAFHAELAQGFDAQSLTLWLAREVQRRLRTLHVEAETPIWEDWLLLRALWFASTRADPVSVQASESLRRQILGFAEGWVEMPRLGRVAEAWRLSESPLPEETYATRIDRARWRLHRHDYAGALDLLEELAREFPDAAEPVQRQAEVLRAAGRLHEAARRLAPRCHTTAANAADRLEYAELLRRLGRLDEAEVQLQLAASAGFDEPGFFLQHAALAEALDRTDGIQAWFQRGLERHPRSAMLRAGYADWLIRRNDLAHLADLLRGEGGLEGLDPDHVAAVQDLLSADCLSRLRNASDWWLGWQWLAWERLPGRSLRLLETRARAITASGSPTDALGLLQPALAAGLPLSDLWLHAARLADLTGRPDESERGFRFATLLGCGRPDAQLLQQTREARRRPLLVARELGQQLELRPEERPLRLAFVHALLRAHEVTAARHALASLLEEDPNDPEIRGIAAEVEAALGNIRQARALHESILRQDPLAADPRANLETLREANQLGLTAGIDYQGRSNTRPTADPAFDEVWQEMFVSSFWRQPFAQVFSVEYHAFERSDDYDQQLWLEWTRGLGRDWVVRARGGAGLEADYTSRARAGVGLSYTLTDTVALDLDALYLWFADIQVGQITPGITWRWHPRGTLMGRVYVGHNRLESGTAEMSVTTVVSAGWQWTRQSLLTLHAAWGDENSANPTADLIGNDSFQSYGLVWRWDLDERWTLTPAYRYEIHEGFDLHGATLSLGYTY